MTRYGQIKKILDGIVNGKDVAVDMEYYPISIKTHINKTEILKHLHTILDSKKPEYSSEDVALGLFGYERKAITLSLEAKTKISKLINLVEESVNECKHEHLAIIPLKYGGGFSPHFFLPEIICPDCWLNVTVKNEDTLNYFKPTTLEEDIGIKISDEDLKSIHDFVEECVHSPLKIHIQFPDKILSDPLSVYDSSQKYMGKYTIKIINKELFESKSGI